MPALVAELVGRVLWWSESAGVRFVGAMLAIGAMVLGVILGVQRRRR